MQFSSVQIHVYVDIACCNMLLLRYFLFGRQVRVGKSDKQKSWYNPSHFVHLYNAIFPREFHDCFPMSYIRPELKTCHWLAKELKQVCKPIAFYRKKSEHGWWTKIIQTRLALGVISGDLQRDTKTLVMLLQITYLNKILPIKKNIL